MFKNLRSYSQIITGLYGSSPSPNKSTIKQFKKHTHIYNLCVYKIDENIVALRFPRGKKKLCPWVEREKSNTIPFASRERVGQERMNPADQIAKLLSYIHINIHIDRHTSREREICLTDLRVYTPVKQI